MTGENGPRVSGHPIDASVRDALSNCSWWVSAFRSRNPIISLLKECLPPVAPILHSEVDDLYLWQVGNHTTTNKFSAKDIWASIFPSNVSAPWSTSIWFKGIGYILMIVYKVGVSQSLHHVSYAAPQMNQAHLSPPNAFEDGLRWIKDPVRDPNISLIIKLLYQASIYAICCERNSRLHSDSLRPQSALVSDIQLILRCHLDPLSRA
ncbi:uncharacterized protein LOC112089705 [Eutrema salsugineum]|uniref:uncharacterized protein LOC112089705 n=1 Tax=Eutrema salsugineum TaxID=72664 RepID=UPI000CED7AB2|nr:uncharacterized protein LOC112089705 [Eutrema salsugineum]